MCLICLEWEKEKMTSKEALQALGEIAINSTDEAEVTHMFELANKILDKEENFDDDEGGLDIISFEDLYEEDSD